MKKIKIYLGLIAFIFACYNEHFFIDELNAGIYIISVKTDNDFLSKKIFKE
jgi:hypothetical protein